MVAGVFILEEFYKLKYCSTVVYSFKSVNLQKIKIL